ncbi:MAG: hypothetical protein P1Q69_12385 [Candidatus Thorarchaeota archaeon]|nr:hypothetical protein [Candidatus Thorarchaeota archaeon]
MKRIHTVAIMILIGILFVNTATNVEAVFMQSEDSGPTIEWYGPENSSSSVVIAWDGAYTGQTEDGWSLRAWINDTHGVDTVIYMIRETTETEWENVTPSLVEGNDTIGYYQYNYTYAVWWNYNLNRPQVEGTGGNFDFKIFANDSLGHWTETGILTYSGGYMLVVPPPEVSFITNLLPSLVGATVLVVIISAVVILRKRH